MALFDLLSVAGSGFDWKKVLDDIQRIWELFKDEALEPVI